MSGKKFDVLVMSGDLNAKSERLRIYVSGPMSGYEDANETAFRLGAEWVRYVLGAEAIVPHDLVVADHAGPCPAGRLGASTKAASGLHLEACYLRNDYTALLSADGIVMLPGWRASWGAKHELTLAADIGLRIWFWTSDGPKEAL